MNFVVCRLAVTGRRLRAISRSEMSKRHRTHLAPRDEFRRLAVYRVAVAVHLADEMSTSAIVLTSLREMNFVAMALPSSSCVPSRGAR